MTRTTQQANHAPSPSEWPLFSKGAFKVTSILGLVLASYQTLATTGSLLIAGQTPLSYIRSQTRLSKLLNKPLLRELNFKAHFIKALLRQLSLERGFEATSFGSPFEVPFPRKGLQSPFAEAPLKSLWRERDFKAPSRGSPFKDPFEGRDFKAPS